MADADKFTVWLTTDVAQAERNADRVREELLKRLREEFVEPPAPDRVTRMVRSSLHEFRSGNTAHQPVIDALALIKRYARAGNTTYYPLGERVPDHRGTTGQWAEVVFKEDTRGRRRVLRMVFEVATFQALREQLRCKEIWVAGAGRWRDPDEDLPRDLRPVAPSTTASCASRWNRASSWTSCARR